MAGLEARRVGALLAAKRGQGGEGAGEVSVAGGRRVVPVPVGGAVGADAEDGVALTGVEELEGVARVLGVAEGGEAAEAQGDQLPLVRGAGGAQEDPGESVRAAEEGGRGEDGARRRPCPSSCR